MKTQILHCHTREVIAESDTLSLRDLAIQHKANLSGAKLPAIDLSGVDMSNSDLSGTVLLDANFSGSNLRGSNFTKANIRRVNFQGADLSASNFDGAYMERSNLRSADLRYSSLNGTRLQMADLTDTRLAGIDSRYANLSETEGVTKAAAWLAQFERDDLGVLVYRRINNGHTFAPTPHWWVIEPGSFITETPDSNRSVSMGCSGVYFGTLEICTRMLRTADLWKCRIRWLDLADVVVPYELQGEARCARLELLEIIEVGDPTAEVCSGVRQCRQSIVEGFEFPLR